MAAFLLVSSSSSKWHKGKSKGGRGKSREEQRAAYPPGMPTGFRYLNGAPLRSTPQNTVHNHQEEYEQREGNLIVPPFLDQFPRLVLGKTIGKYLMIGLSVRTGFLLFLEQPEKMALMISGQWIGFALILIDIDRSAIPQSGFRGPRVVAAMDIGPRRTGALVLPRARPTEQTQKATLVKKPTKQNKETMTGAANNQQKQKQ